MPLTLLVCPPRVNIIFANFPGAFIWNAVLFNTRAFLALAKAPYLQGMLLISATEYGIRLITTGATNALPAYMARLVTDNGHESGRKDEIMERVLESVEQAAKLNSSVLEQVVRSYEAALYS
ncbi:hypothetical protein JX265_001094 [Neoarthrinium moseri]|uniref:Uncharacterized protein n=1 Tax=Neoarthrinium moseri TaxID=1658444 RepID=A0A9Q0AW47_9PEZI|nr:hypothetical protein JX265_001094 [Neoarthrinium moseri]